MVSASGDLVARLAVEQDRVDAPLLGQQLEGAVHGGDAEPRQLDLRPLQHFRHRERPLRAGKHPRNHVALPGAAGGRHGGRVAEPLRKRPGHASPKKQQKEAQKKARKQAASTWEAA